MRALTAMTIMLFASSCAHRQAIDRPYRVQPTLQHPMHGSPIPGHAPSSPPRPQGANYRIELKSFYQQLNVFLSRKE